MGECEIGQYGEQCVSVSDGYNPFRDFDLVYWYDRLMAGDFGVVRFVYAVLAWVMRGVQDAGDVFGGAYQTYMSVVRADGDMLNDWLTHAPNVFVACYWLLLAAARMLAGVL